MLYSVVAAEPQLLLPLMLSFLVFLMLVRSHRTTLLLIPLPAASVCAPTLVNTVRFAGAGTWRQIFGSVILPSSAHDGHPMIANLSDIVSRAFGVAVSGEIWQYVAAAMLALIVLLAAVSLFLPFVLRVSRMMWVVAIAGLATSLLSAAVVVAVDADGAVAGSVLPGVSFTMMGLLSCVCMVAGGAVQRFVMLWQRPTGDVEVERNGASTGIIAGRAARIVLVMLIAASVVASAGFDYVARDHNTVSTSDSGLPIVASDYLAQDEARRVLAVRADSAGSISYNVMRTRRGDLIDSSPAQRVEVAFGRSDDANKAIAKDCAQLLSNADSDAVADLSELGFGGIYVVRSGEDKAQKEITDQLSSNISASDGTQNVVSTDAGTYYRLTIQDTAKQHIDRKGYRQAESSVCVRHGCGAWVLFSQRIVCCASAHEASRSGGSMSKHSRSKTVWRVILAIVSVLVIVALATVAVIYRPTWIHADSPVTQRSSVSRTVSPRQLETYCPARMTIADTDVYGDSEYQASNGNIMSSARYASFGSVFRSSVGLLGADEATSSL
ncbi:MAG: hypothetical protein ACLSUZ_07625, partial [Bifidobacterium pseudocatenulatum]